MSGPSSAADTSAGLGCDLGGFLTFFMGRSPLKFLPNSLASSLTTAKAETRWTGIFRDMVEA